MKTHPDSFDRVSMRDPVPGERRLVCVLRVEEYPITLVVETIVDEKQRSRFDCSDTRAAFLMMKEAVAAWEKYLRESADPEDASTLAEVLELEDFNIGDVSSQVVGYDYHVGDPPEPSDLEFHLIQSGFNAIEFHSFAASDDDGSWSHDDPLRTFD